MVHAITVSARQTETGPAHPTKASGHPTKASGRQSAGEKAALSRPEHERPVHIVLAVVLQVRDGELQVLLWKRAHEPYAGHWALPGGYLLHGEPMEESIRRHLAVKVDVREVAHLEQLESRSDTTRAPGQWQVTTAYMGLVPVDLDPALPEDTAWHPVARLPRRLAFDNRPTVQVGTERLRAKLSYTNIGFALAPAKFTISELREIYVAALGHPVSATNLQRVLLRRGVLVPTGERRLPGRVGGRPPAVFQFRTRDLEITDQFAVLRPPT